MHILFHQRESKETRVNNGTYESLGASQTRGLALDLGPWLLTSLYNQNVLMALHCNFVWDLYIDLYLG